MECFEQKKYYSDDRLVEYDTAKDYYKNQIIGYFTYLADDYDWDIIENENELKRIFKKLKVIYEDLP